MKIHVCASICLKHTFALMIRGKGGGCFKKKFYHFNALKTNGLPSDNPNLS